MPPYTALPIALQLVGVVGSLFVGLLALPVADFGMWPRVELPTLGLWLAAGLCAAGVALERWRLPRALLRSPLLLALAGLTAMTVLFAPFVAHPWLSITGAPQSGQGGLRFVALLAVIISALRLRRVEWARHCLLAAASLAAIGAVFQAYIEFGGARIFVFREYLAYPAISLAVMAIAEFERRSSGANKQRLMLFVPLMIAGAVLIASTNRSAWLGVVAAAILAALAAAARSTPRLAWIASRPALAVVVALVPWAILAGIMLAGLEAPVESVRSRARVLTVLVDAVAAAPGTWAVGQGWGSTTELFAMHLTAAPAPLWDSSWDAASRDIFHSHHDGFETFLALGLGGAALWTLLSVAPVLMAPAMLLPAAVLFSGSLAVVDATWFQFPFATGAVAVAIAWIVDVGGEDAVSPASRSYRAAAVLAAATLGLSVAIVGAWGFSFANARRTAALDVPACAEFPSETWRGEVALSYFFDQTLQRHRHLLARNDPAGAGDLAPLMRLFCAVDRRAALGKSPYVMMVGLLLRNEAAFAGGLPQGLRQQLAVDWELRLREFLRLAPRRSDLAAPMLAVWLQDRQFGRVDGFARMLLENSIRDPVGLYFGAVVRLALAESPRQLEEGVRLLQLAVDNGIERIIPLDQNLRNLISSRH